jgi:uncharacterized membrane protein YkvA (DUF1232 family)
MSSNNLEDISERWLSSLQQDIKDFLHVVGDDQDLPDDVRTAAVAAVLYTLAPGDIIPDSTGVLGYLDDALALRVALERVRAAAPDRFEQYRDRAPELITSADEDLDAFREALGELYEPFAARVLSPERNEFKGKRAADVLDLEGAAWLDEEITVAALKLDFKPSAVQSAARKAETIVPTIRQRLAPRR